MARTSVPTAPPLPARSFRDDFLKVYDEEHHKTLRVLRAYPTDKTDLRPNPRIKTALELAWMFVYEQVLVEKALTTGFDWAKPMAFPPLPDSLDAVIDAFQKGHDHIRGLISVQRDEELSQTIQFPVGPGKIGDWTKTDYLRQVLHDQIHHRGQFSIYLRIAGGKLPSIYGPTADEPWF